jgi:hypothetical protein
MDKVMKFTNTVSVAVFSRHALLKPKLFLDRLMLHSEMLPHMCPTKWGWWEPTSNVWDVRDLSKFIPDDRGGNTDRIIWTRGLKPKAEGNLSVSIKPAAADGLRSHATEWIHCELLEFSQEPMIDYIQRLSILLDGDIAFIHHIVEEEKTLRRAETEYEGCFVNTVDLSFSTPTLRHWLPELPWAVVFGQAYVRMFSMERLLSAPAYVVKQLSDDAVYLQLSPKLTDLLDDYAVVDAVRQKVKDHIGRDTFFDVAKAYPLRGPLGKCTGAQIMAFKPPPPIGTVFRVPDFQMIDDDIVDS